MTQTLVYISRVKVFRGSSAAEQLAVNQFVVGSIPTLGESLDFSCRFFQDANH